MKRVLVGALAFGALVAWVVPNTAAACGGLFCDGGPQPMPVDQTGEHIIFSERDDGGLDVHILIQYEGEAAAFAWVVPIQSTPTDFAVGSQTFFTNVQDASVPTYGFTTQFDDCGLSNDAPAGGNGFDSDAAGEEGEGAPEEDPGAPTVFAQEQVGAFEITVIGEGTPQGVITWLDDNGYQQDDEAEPILAKYLEDGFQFAAIKLTGGAGVDEIHPVVFSFEAGTEACVPLQLTRIAAQDDMEVRTYFLGSERVVPQNYRHVLVNPLMIDWPSQAANYKEVITMAVDADHADGRAFVTEYAGPSDIISDLGVYSETWNADVFAELEPANVVNELVGQGLFFCDFDFGQGCSGLHPMVDALLSEYLPVPDGLQSDQFYECVECFEGQIDADAYNGAEFAQKMQERIIDPGRAATELISQHPYLTRMYTTISPEEMTLDPMFHANPDLEDVANVRTATQRVLCSGDNVWILPDGREIFVPSSQSWPSFQAEMPWEEEVSEVPAFGAPVVLADNEEVINNALANYNAGQGWAGSDSLGDQSSGCGCRSEPQGNNLAVGLFLVGFGLVARRRRHG